MDNAVEPQQGQYTIPGMLVLALDTTSRGGSVAVVRDEQVLSLIDGDASRTHGERLPGEIDAALVRASVHASELDLLAVASGPGAFTGLRIGLATIQGMAMVLSKPVIGVSALEALAVATWHDRPSASRVVAWMDAQRGEVFAASFGQPDGASDFRAMHTDAIVAVPDGALAAVPFPASEDVWFVGDGALRYRDLIVSRWGSRAHMCDAVPALAPAVAGLGQRLAANGAAGPPHALQPLYVRRPDAELDRERQAHT